MRLLSVSRLMAQAAVTTVGGFLVVAGAAGETDYGIGYAGEYSSNIRRTTTNPENEWINSVIVGFTYTENTVDLTARARAQAQYRTYSHDTFGDEKLYLLDSSLLWTILPRRLSWVVEDAFSEVILDPTAASTPTNRAGANAFSTGPDAMFQINPVNALRLSARYGNVYVGNTGLDNNRYTGLVGWEYQSSAVTQWSLNVQHTTVDYENDVAAPDFQQNDVFLRMARRFSESQLTLDAGKTKFKRDTGGESDGSLLRARWTRNLSATSSFGLTLASEFQDTGAELLSYVSAPGTPVTGGPPPAVGNNVVTNDIYYSRRADVFYTRQAGRTYWTVRATGRDLDFETTLQDRREAGFNFDLTYNYSALGSASLIGRYLRTDFVDAVPPRDDEDVTAALRFAYQARRHLRLMLEGRRTERASTDPLAEFVDKRALFTIQYTTGPLYAPFAP